MPTPSTPTSIRSSGPVPGNHKPPTTKQLLTLLPKLRVRVIRRFPDPHQTGEWRPDDAHDDAQGTIVVATSPDRKRGMDGLITYGLHELIHAYYQLICQDDRAHEERVYRWESVLFKSRALREAMAVRIGNASIFRVEDP